ncbi:hypothetical protein QYM36_009305 [Artemia franciscana]|nr:hypothetical protein QYM36_009305 [Artemia franciscana]
MLHGMHTKHAVEQLKSEGYRNLYRGLLPPLCQKTVSISIMFGMYDKFQHLITQYFPQVPHQTNKSVSAMLAGWTEAILCPFERVQMIMQDQHYQNRFKNTFHAFSELKPYGVKEYYRGLVPILVRNGFSNVMFFYLREHIKPLLPHTESHIGNLISDFVCGAMVGAFISTVFYPVNIIKTHMQCHLGGPHQSMTESFKVIYHQRGQSLHRMFYGVHVNYTRALLSWGIINASYELLHKLLYQKDMTNSH